jgi:hypothetical protein
LTYNFCALSATYFSMRSMFVAESLLSSLQVGVDDVQSWWFAGAKMILAYASLLTTRVIAQRQDYR